MHLVPVLFILVVILSICKGQHDNNCDTFPKDQYIESGSSVKVVCQTSCVNGKIYWTLNNEPVDESLSNTVNSTYTSLSLSNFTHHTATLLCHSADYQQVLGGSIIRTYSKPGNISCILHYEKENKVIGVPELFTCTWEHRVHASQKINYTVLCASPKHTPPIEICNSQVTNCTVKDLYDNIYIGDNLNVAVRAKTAAWVADSGYYEFQPYRILKINPPEFAVTAFTDYLSVQWNRDSFDSEMCRCQVQYSKVSSADEETPQVINQTVNGEENGKIRIEVESCVNYRLSARCALDQAPWSDWSQEKTVLTKLTKRHIRLRLWRKVAELENSGVRKVGVMWTDVPSTCQGTFIYTVKRSPYKEHVTGVNYTYTSCGDSTCDVDVNQDAHRINLSVFHNEVLLAEESVYVPAAGESLPQVTDIQTSTHEGAILVTWKAPVQPVSGYVIDWTHNGNQYDWKESKYTNATLFDLLDKKAYNITVTPLFDDKTGHGTQALQICSRVGDPGNVAIVTLQAFDKSAYVSWDTKSEDACSGAVINYTVFYGTQKGPLLNVTVDRKKQNVFLRDLNPDTQYSVYVEATALTGTTASRERLFKTKRFDPNLVTVLTVCGILIIVLVLSLGLCCAIQWKKFREKPVPNPGLSSLALWPSLSHQKAMCPFQLFSNPSESICDRVYTEETRTASTPSLAASSYGTAASDQTEEYTDPAAALAPDVQDGRSADPAGTRHPSSPEESPAFLSSESSAAVSPYRSQSSVERKQGQHVPAKQQEKTTPKTIYVTLDMFERGQGR